VDISEGKGDITVKAEIPGREAEDIDVQLESRLLENQRRTNLPTCPSP
jgi:HSP20 family molecular chaperone IbpA